MALLETNWKSFLSPDSDLPPDVFFQVTNYDDKSSGKTLGAHRLLLAAVSPVFRKMLFGPIKETRDVIPMKDTTPEAFGKMISYIYKPSEDQFTLSECPQKLFELLALADRYELVSLENLAAEALKTLPLSDANLIFSATVAKRFRVFEEVSCMLWWRCQEFLLREVLDGDDVYNLISETKKNFPEADFDILLELKHVGKDILQLPGLTIILGF